MRKLFDRLVTLGIMGGILAVVLFLLAFTRMGWMEDTLLSGLSSGWQVALAKGVGAFIVAFLGLLPIVYLTWMERKVVARIQDRIGPNLAGPWGLLQAMADAIKMFTKEDITPTGADRVVYNLAPILMAAMALMVYAVFPLAPGDQPMMGTDLSVGILYVLAVGSFSTVAVMMAGWGSNNKFSLISAFRVVAQLVSYEIPMVLAVITPIMLAGSMSTVDIIESQNVIYVLALPISALIFLISGFAESARSPFDLLEAESEIVAGFHVEYSGMKFALFYLAEYAHIFSVSVMTTIMFLGGWKFFGLENTFPWLAPIIMIAKATLVVFTFMWARGTLPRLRIDHLLAFNWKFLVPLSLVNVMVVALVSKALENASAWAQTGALLAANLLMLLGVYLLLSLAGRRARQQAVAAQEPVEETLEPAAAH